MEFSQAPGDLFTPQGPEENSQDETNSLVNVKVKPELHFCGQTDDGISWRPGIIIGSAQNCHLKSRLWGGCTTKWHSKSTEVFLQAALMFPLPPQSLCFQKSSMGWLDLASTCHPPIPDQGDFQKFLGKFLVFFLTKVRWPWHLVHGG